MHMFFPITYLTSCSCNGGLTIIIDRHIRGSTTTQPQNMFSLKQLAPLHIHLEDLQDTAPLPGKSITISGLVVILIEIQFVSLYLPVLVKIYHI